MKHSRLMLRLLAMLALATQLGGCSWGIWDFLRDSKTRRPDKLVSFDEEVRIKKNWSVGVGDGQGDEFNRLRPALVNGVIYAAGADGVVVAVRASDGKRLWKQDLDKPISGAIGAGGSIAVVGTEKAEIIALDTATGQTKWQTNVSSEVLAAPATDGKIVVVQGLDGRLSGLDAADGKQVWSYDNQVPALTLRGTSSPLIVGNTVLSAQAGGTVVALALDNGTLRWEERIALPKGKSDLDRLVDIDGDLVVGEGNMLLATSYQGNLSAVDMNTGQTRWRVKESSYVGAGFGFGNIYSVTDEDTVNAYRIGQDTPQWSNDQMTLRRLTQPVGFNNYLALGDYEGYIHFLAQSDGRFVGRVKVDGDGVRSHMLAEGNTLYVLSNGGDLVSYTITDRSAK